MITIGAADPGARCAGPDVQQLGARLREDEGLPDKFRQGWRQGMDVFNLRGNLALAPTYPYIPS